MKLRRIGATFAALVALVAGPLPGAGGVTPAGQVDHQDDPVVRVLTTFAAPGCASGCGSGSTIGPDGALYVTDGPGGRVLRIDPDTGATTTFASGLPQALPEVGIGGAVDVIFVGRTAYVAVTLVGPDFGQPDVVSGLYRIGRDGDPTPVADIGAWSAANPSDSDYFVPSGVVYSLERYRGRLLAADGHHNRVLSVSRDGDISELQTFGNVVPTGLEAKRGAVYMAQAGPVPHNPEDGKVVRFRADGPTAEVAAGGPLLVDVEAGQRHRLYALSQGVWDLPDLPENAGAPASPDTGALMIATSSGDLVPLVEGLDRPTSVEIRRDTAWVVTLTGTVLRIDGV